MVAKEGEFTQPWAHIFDIPCLHAAQQGWALFLKKFASLLNLNSAPTSTTIVAPWSPCLKNKQRGYVAEINRVMTLVNAYNVATLLLTQTNSLKLLMN